MPESKNVTAAETGDATNEVSYEKPELDELLRIKAGDRSARLDEEQERTVGRLVVNGSKALVELGKGNELYESQLEEAARAVKLGRLAVGVLVAYSEGLVKDIAERTFRRRPGNDITLDDFIQEGYIGLLRAIQKFNPERGLRLNTYATYWVTASVTRLSQNNPAYVAPKLSYGEYELGHAIRNAYSNLTRNGINEPTEAELAREYMRISNNQGADEESVIVTIRYIKGALRPSLYFDAPLEDGSSQWEVFASEYNQKDFGMVEAYRILLPIIKSLGYGNDGKQMQKVVLYMLGDYDDGMIAEQLGITARHVGVLRRKAIEAMRDIVHGRETGEIIDILHT